MASSLGSTLASASDVFCGCDYCGDDREAAGFCTNCQDFLCVECFKSHLKPRRLRHHVLLDRDQMPCPEDRNRRGADGNTGSQDDQSSDSSSVGTPDTFTRPGLTGLPEPAEQGAGYRPTLVSGRACTTVLPVLTSILLAFWLANPHFLSFARKTHAEHVGDIAVKDDGEMGMMLDLLFDIPGSVVMPGDKLVTVSPWSARVKLIDLKTNTVVAQLNNSPLTLWDVTQISDTHVAVTCYNEQKIYFVNVGDELKLDRSVKANGKCAGITRLNDNLLVTYYNPLKVELLNMKGQLVKTVFTITQGECLFQWPDYVAVSPDQSTIYISDWYRNTVTRLSLTGEVLAMYIPQDKISLDKPRGLVVDKYGSVYVCGFDSHNVVQLAADLTQPRQLLQESDGVKWPRSVSYCQATDRLYIGMWQSRVVKVYQLK